MLERLLRVVASRWFRLVLVGLFITSLQTTLFSEVRPFGFAVQVVAIFVAGAGCSHDVQTGAVVGLVSGLMYDAVLATPLGISALVFAGVGAAGSLVLQPFRDPTWWMKVLAASGVAALGEVLMPIVKGVVGLGGWLQLRILGAMSVTFIGAVFLSVPLIPLARWTLRERVGRDV